MNKVIKNAQHLPDEVEFTNCEFRIPKVDLIANIVNGHFLDTDYIGKDWEQVRTKLIKKLRKELKEYLREKISCIDADYQGEDYRKGFNETKHKAIEIVKKI